MLILTRADFEKRYVYISLDEDALLELQESFVFLNKLRQHGEIDFSLLRIPKVRNKTSWIFKAEVAIRDARHQKGYIPKQLVFPSFVQQSNGFYVSDAYDYKECSEVIWGLSLLEKFWAGDIWSVAEFMKKELESLRLSQYVSSFLDEILVTQEGLKKEGKKRIGCPDLSRRNKVTELIHGLKNFTENNIAETNNAINNPVI